MPDTDTDKVANSTAAITTVLEQVRKGEFATEAGDAFAELVRDCVTLQRPGTFTLTLAVKPDDPFVKLEARWQSTPPKPDPTVALLWPDDAGNLHRSDPNQQSMF